MNTGCTHEKSNVLPFFRAVQWLQNVDYVDTAYALQKWEADFAPIGTVKPQYHVGVQGSTYVVY